MLHCRGVLRQGVAPAGTVSYDLSLAPACGRRLGWPPFIRSVLRLSRAALAARRALQGTRGEVVPAQCCTSKLISDGCIIDNRLQQSSPECALSEEGLAMSRTPEVTCPRKPWLSSHPA